MDAEHHQLELKKRRTCHVDGRRVDGWQYKNENGVLAWHVRTWPNSGDPIDDYWVEGDKFFEVTGLHMAVNMLPLNRIETGRLVVGIVDEKRDAILKSIAEWEKEEGTDGNS